MYVVFFRLCYRASQFWPPLEEVGWPRRSHILLMHQLTTADLAIYTTSDARDVNSPRFSVITHCYIYWNTHTERRRRILHHIPETRSADSTQDSHR